MPPWTILCLFLSLYASATAQIGFPNSEEPPLASKKRPPAPGTTPSNESRNLWETSPKNPLGASLHKALSQAAPMGEKGLFRIQGTYQAQLGFFLLSPFYFFHEDHPRHPLAQKVFFFRENHPNLGPAQWRPCQQADHFVPLATADVIFDLASHRKETPATKESLPISEEDYLCLDSISQSLGATEKISRSCGDYF